MNCSLTVKDSTFNFINISELKYYEFNSSEREVQFFKK